jgi:drug/metabolite transporter (DMT)-like permease
MASASIIASIYYILEFPMNAPAGSSATMRDWMIFLAVPLFFSSNLIFGRGIIGEVSPYTTAFLRWGGSTLIVLPFMLTDWRSCWHFIRTKTLLWLVLGFLGMGICGGLVYWGLLFTTAANGTLIYTSSTLFIILFQRIFERRPIRRLELVGMLIAFFGITAIVLKGDISQLLELSFNVGDFAILIAAISFAAYSLLLKDPQARKMASLSLFGVIALAGAAVLAPAALYELSTGGQLPTSMSAFGMIAGMIIFSSVAAFYCFTHVVRVFGPAQAGVTLYLTPPVSILMAVIFLGEPFLAYHLVGIILVTGGVILSTFPARK